MNEYKNILFGTVSEKWNKLVKETCVKDSELAEHLLLIHERFCVDQCSLKTRKNGQNNMPDLDPFKNDISLDMEVQDENEEDCRLRDPSRDKGDTAVHIKGEPPDAYENSYTQTSVQGNISNTTSHTCNTNGPTPAKKTLSKYSIVVDTFGKPLGVVQASEDGSKNQILPILTTIQPTDIIQIRSALEKSSSQTNPNEDSSTVKSSLPSQSNQNISRKNSTSLSSQTQKRLKEIGPVNDSESVMGTDLERSVEDEHNLGEEEPNQEEDQIEDEVEDDQEDEDNCNLQEDSEDDSYNSGEEESEDGSPQYTPPAKKRRTRLNKEDSVDDSYHSGDEESEDGSPQYSPPAKKRKTGQQKNADTSEEECERRISLPQTVKHGSTSKSSNSNPAGKDLTAKKHLGNESMDRSSISTHALDFQNRMLEMLSQVIHHLGNISSSTSITAQESKEVRKDINKQGTGSLGNLHMSRILSAVASPSANRKIFNKSLRNQKFIKNQKSVCDKVNGTPSSERGEFGKMQQTNTSLVGDQSNLMHKLSDDDSPTCNDQAEDADKQTKVVNSQNKNMQMKETSCHSITKTGNKELSYKSSKFTRIKSKQREPIEISVFNFPVQDIPEEYKVDTFTLNNIYESSVGPGNFAKKLVTKFFPELFTRENLRQQYSYFGGGKLNKKELDPVRRDIIKRYVLLFHPELDDISTWNSVVVSKVNEGLRRPDKRPDRMSKKKPNSYMYVEDVGDESIDAEDSEATEEA